jgi:hypothetical protein
MFSTLDGEFLRIGPMPDRALPRFHLAADDFASAEIAAAARAIASQTVSIDHDGARSTSAGPRRDIDQPNAHRVVAMTLTVEP